MSRYDFDRVHRSSILDFKILHHYLHDSGVEGSGLSVVGLAVVGSLISER